MTAESRGPWIAMALFSLVFLCGGFMLLRQFPAFNTDEVFIAVHGENLVKGAGSRYSLYDDIFAPETYAFRDAFMQAVEPMYNAWVGIWMRLSSRSYIGMRLSSLVAAWLALWVFFAIGRQLGGASMGLAIAFFLGISPAFLTASCVTRPETFLLLMSSLAVWAALRLLHAPARLKSIVGVMVGLLLGIHPNALIMVAGFGVFYAVRETQPENRRESLVWFIVGVVAGAIAVQWNLDIPKLKLCQQTIFAQMYRPPILSLGQHPLAILASLGDALKTTAAYYFNDPNTRIWVASLTAWRLGAALCVCAGLPRVWQELKQRGGSRQHSAFVLAWLMALVASACMMQKHEAIYELNFFPLLLPAAAGFWGSPTLSRVWQRRVTLVAASAAGISVLLFGCFVRQLRATYTPYPKVIGQFQALVPDTGLKVVAPNIFWPVWDPARFRDIGAMSYSHWYTGGARTVGSWLGQWQPDIVIIDGTQSHLFMHDQRGAAVVSQLLGVPTVLLGTIETGPGSYGPLDVYRVTWR